MTTRRLLTTAAALALVATACGSSSKAAPTTTAAKSASTTVAGAAGSTSSTTVVYKGDKNSEYCKLSAQLNALDFSSVAAEKASIATELALIPKLSSTAPKEIKADIAVIVKLLPQFDALMKKYNYDASALATTPNAADLKAWKDFQTGTELGDASTHLTEYDVQVCGIDNGSSSSTGDTSVTTVGSATTSS
jgi:hypothetical protein